MRSNRIAYFTLVGLVAYTAIATDLYLPAIPAIVKDLQGSVADGQLTLSLFMIGIALGQLVFGPLSDYFGRLPVVKIGTLLFVVTAIAAALAPTMMSLWVLRLLQGISAASGTVIARAIVSDNYHGSEAAKVMATLGAAMAVIPLMAPTLGSGLLLLGGWRLTFFALAVFGAIVLLGLRQFEESAPAIREGTLSFGHVFKQFAHCLQHRRFIGFQLCGTSSFAAIFAYLSTISFILYDIFAVTPALFGVAFMISVAGFMGGSLTSAGMARHFGSRHTMIVGCVLSFAAASWVLFSAYNQYAHWLVYAGGSASIFFGVGLTFANASMGAIALFPRKAGAASAVYGFTHASFSAAIGVVAGITYDGTLLPTALLIWGCTTLTLLGLWLSRPDPAVQSTTHQSP